MVLFPVGGKNYIVGENGIPAWGDFRVLNSRPDAFRSLSLDEQDKRYVRLLHIAKYQQLKRILLPRKVLCGPEAELYLRLANTYPIFYTRWVEEADDAHFELKCGVPQSGSRADLLRAFNTDYDSRERFVAPVTTKVFRSFLAAGDRKMLFYMRPGSIVVRSRGFEVHGSSQSDSSPIPATKRKHSDGINKGETEPARKMWGVNDGSDSSSNSNNAKAEEESWWEDEHAVVGN